MDMRRRELISLIGGTAASSAFLSLSARAQQAIHVRRVGFLTGFSEAAPDAQQRIAALREGLEPFGWIEGRNLQIYARWAGGDVGLLRRYFEELMSLNLDMMITGHTLGAQLMLQAPRPIPTVFVGIA